MSVLFNPSQPTTPGGASGQLQFNNAGIFAGVSTLTFDGNNVTLAGRLINSYTSVASSPAKVFTGTWFTNGTATTTKPHFLIEPTGTTSASWSTAGTGLGVNAPSGFTGRLLDLQLNGTSQFNVDSTGRVSVPLGTVALPSIYPGADTDTGIFSPGANTLAISSNGVERIRLDSVGRLGLNTTSPDVDLHFGLAPAGGSCGVIGFGDISGSRCAEIEGLRLDSSFSGSLVFKTQPTASDGSAGTERLRITNSHLIFQGNGITNASPASSTLSATGGSGTNIAGAGLTIRGGISTGSAAGGSLLFQTTPAGSAGTSANTSTTRLTITSAGLFQIANGSNVELGTTTGTKIGTATNQLLGFFNATPVVQPAAVANITTTASAGSLPTPDGSVTIANAATPTVAELLEYCVELEAKLEDALGRLRTLGLIAT